MNVKELKKYVQDILDKLEDYDDDQEISFSCNTYGLSSHILEVGSKGFLDLNNLENHIEESEEEG